MDFSRYILGETDKNLFLSTTQELYNSHINFMCALDFDTKITRNAVSRLLEKHKKLMESNNIRIENRNVVQGYGILQPHIKVQPKKTSPFDTETTLSDVEEDDKDKRPGTFYGKGMIHIPTFVKCLYDRLPKGKILSHDIVEGEILRTFSARDITLLESAPTSLKQIFNRNNRWTRGDTQNLVLLRDNSFPTKGKVKIVINVIKALMPIPYDWQTMALFPISLSNNVIAISQSLIRLLITKKNLLLWTPYNNYDRKKDSNSDNYCPNELQVEKAKVA
jgi:cyclic beta-1,2-glucan synthetase